MADRDVSPTAALKARRAGKQPVGRQERDRHKSIDGYGEEDRVEEHPLNALAVGAFPGEALPVDDKPLSSPRASRAHVAKESDRRQPKAGQRSHKPRSSGAFLLSDTIHHDPDDRARTQSHRRTRYSTESPEAKSTFFTPEKPLVSPQGKARQSLTPVNASNDNADPARPDDGTTSTRRGSGTDRPVSHEASAAVSSPLDVASAQIVSMALNLSESRRLAARRNVSQPVPPRLAPLPDSSAGGSLRQHFQQQRRVSRTISPKPDIGAFSSGGADRRLGSPLQTPFEPDTNYRYRFSQSTLSRAQKAKDYLELLAQYRRIMDLVPPLQPGSGDLQPISGHLQIPGRPHHGAGIVPSLNNDRNPGRAYNPLQYIRNRKVRARERQVIDSEGQGFNDVLKVTDWVDEAAKSVIDGQTSVNSTTLPPFLAADEAVANTSPSMDTSKPAATMSKPTRRPRVDWVIEPADMIADAYWLEQGDHKKFVEDRHWKRVFPQDDELYRPISRQTGGSAPHPMIPVEQSTVPEPSTADFSPAKGEHEHVFSNARERAHQKLQALKGFHHHRRNSSSIHHHDFLGSHHGSVSDSSDTDSDRRKRARNGTIGSSGRDILEKQMMDMIARETRDRELNDRRNRVSENNQSPVNGSKTPDRQLHVRPTVPKRVLSHKRQDSTLEVSEAESRNGKTAPSPASPYRTGRASLEVPTTGKRTSLDYDTSPINSPELKPARGSPYVPTIGMDLSPVSSRTGSPTRRPFSKVKGIFRDRSQDRGGASVSDGKGDSPAAAMPPHSAQPSSALSDMSSRLSLERKRSPSPVQNYGEAETGYKSPRRIGRLRRQDSNLGLRGLLKAPRIDSVLRSGVSKVSELLWRKEASEPATLATNGAENLSVESSDESEIGSQGRGRPLEPVSPTRGASRQPNLTEFLNGQRGKTDYLGIMPSFESHRRSGSIDEALLPVSKPASRRSSRFDLLKPPKIDVEKASPQSSPPPELAKPEAPESRKSYTDGVMAADARLNAVLALPPKPRLLSTSSSSSPRERHWSISDRRPSSQSMALQPTPVCRAEIARLRALLLSSGITARELDRRAKEHPLHVPGGQGQSSQLVAAAAAVAQKQGRQWQRAAADFANTTAPSLRARAEALRRTAAALLEETTRRAADDADELARDAAVGRRLEAKTVVDTIEKMLRRRRRRFRWARRAGWLAVEWVLVGFMWYVWFVVMIARIVWGVGRGVGAGVRWLLWL